MPFRFLPVRHCLLTASKRGVVITYRTDSDALREVVPEPLEVAGDTVAYEFIRMPDPTGFGDYTETRQVVPVRFCAKDAFRSRAARQ